MRTRHVAVAALAALTLAACGGTDGNGEAAKTGPQVAADAAAALEQAGAAHLVGSGTSDGQPMDVDLHLQDSDVSGSITMQGQKVALVNTGGKLYVSAPAAFWAKSGVPAAAMGLVADKWIVVPADASSDLTKFSLSGIADELRHPSGGATIKDAVRTASRDGQKVVVVTETDGSTLEVAATGKPYPLRTVDKGTETGTITITDIGKRTTITAPQGAVDFSQLLGS